MIFRKNKPESTQPQAQPEETPQVAQQPTPEMPAQPSQAPVEQPAAMPSGNASLLTSDVVMEGNLLTSGELHLDGTVHGAVQASRVVIDVNGAVNGQVVAQEIIVRGRAIGPICGVRVELAPGAQVQGDVISQSIVVQDGAFIDGQIRHSEDPLGEWQQMWQEAEATEDGMADEMPEHQQPVEELSLHGAAEEQAVEETVEAVEVAEEEPPAPYLRPANEDAVAEAGSAEAEENAEAQSQQAAETDGKEDGEKEHPARADA